MVFHVQQSIHHRVPCLKADIQPFHTLVQIGQVCLQFPVFRPAAPGGKTLDDGKGVLHIMLHPPYAGMDAFHLLHMFLQALHLLFKNNPAALFPVPTDHVLEQLHPIQDGKKRQEQDCRKYKEQYWIPVIQKPRRTILHRDHDNA